MISFRGMVAWTSLTAAAIAAPLPVVAEADDGAWCAAMDLYQAARYAEARAALRRMEKGVPDAELDFHLGRLALWFDDDEEASRRLERAMAAAPRDARMHNAWGDACGLAAQRAALWQKPVWARRCLAAYRHAVELEPLNPRWRWSLIGFSCVAPRIVGGGFERARAEVAELGRLDPLEGVIATATVLLAEHRATEAFAGLEAALRDQPENVLLWYQLGRCAAVSGDQLARGITALRRCLELGPPGGDGRPTEAVVRFRLSEVLRQAGDVAAAHEERTAALRLQPDLRIDKVALRL